MTAKPLALFAAAARRIKHVTSTRFILEHGVDRVHYAHLQAQKIHTKKYTGRAVVLDFHLEQLDGLYFVESADDELFHAPADGCMCAPLLSKETVDIVGYKLVSLGFSDVVGLPVIDGGVARERTWADAKVAVVLSDD